MTCHTCQRLVCDRWEPSECALRFCRAQRCHEVVGHGWQSRWEPEENMTERLFDVASHLDSEADWWFDQTRHSDQPEFKRRMLSYLTAAHTTGRSGAAYWSKLYVDAHNYAERRTRDN